MLIPILFLFTTLLVLLVLYVVDEAQAALCERAGVTRSGNGMRWTKRMGWVILVLVAAQLFVPRDLFEQPPPQVATFSADSLWTGADTMRLAFLDQDEGELVRYGRELVRNTASYLGPKGSVAQQTNGMNCQNCHLEAGTKPWGNNYGAVWSTYPKFRERSGSKETVVKRINDCFERSLNGSALDSTSHEMRALVAYMHWLGTGITAGQKPKGCGITDLPFLDRAADPVKGEAIYAAQCVKCHQADGQGLPNTNGSTYQYPPLWGDHSFTIGAGLYRLSRFAGYVKNNMPQGATWQNPQLTDEQAWDVAAYVNSRQRPDHDLSKDWPNIAGKPVDHPFGPYADAFTETQHKYGPYAPIAEAKAGKKRP